MLYMVSCIIVMLTALYEIHKNLYQMVSGEINSRPQVGMMLLTVLMSGSFTAPLLATILKVAAPEATITPNESIRWSVYLVLVGSVLVAGYAYLTLKRTPSAQRGSFWTVGHTLTLAVVAFVGVASAISHLTFFKSSKDGIANIELIRDDVPLKDMVNCTAGVAFIQFREDGGALHYRCPTLMMFGGFTSQPFAPWPDYVEGESQELATFIHDATLNARKADPQ